MTQAKHQREPSPIAPPRQKPDDALSDAALDLVSGGTVATEKTTTMKAGADAQSGLAGNLKAS